MGVLAGAPAPWHQPPVCDRRVEGAAGPGVVELRNLLIPGEVARDSGMISRTIPI